MKGKVAARGKLCPIAHALNTDIAESSGSFCTTTQ